MSRAPAATPLSKAILAALKGDPAEQARGLRVVESLGQHLLAELLGLIQPSVLECTFRVS